MSAPFTVRLEEATLADLDRLAERTERSRNWLVGKAIEQYLAVNAWQIERIGEGIAAADRGDFASYDEIDALRARFRTGR